MKCSKVYLLVFIFLSLWHILWPEGTEILFSLSTWSQWCNNSLGELISYGGCRRLGKKKKVAPFFLGQAEACRRLMEEEVSAENFIHTLFSQDTLYNLQQALTKAICMSDMEMLISYIGMLYWWYRRPVHSYLLQI